MWNNHFENEYLEILQELPLTVPADTLEEAKAAITSFKTMWLVGQQEQWSRQFQDSFRDTWISSILEDVTGRYWFFRSYTKTVKIVLLKYWNSQKKLFKQKLKFLFHYQRVQLLQGKGQPRRPITSIEKPREIRWDSQRDRPRKSYVHQHLQVQMDSNPIHSHVVCSEQLREGGRISPSEGMWVDYSNRGHKIHRHLSNLAIMLTVHPNIALLLLLKTQKIVNNSLKNWKKNLVVKSRNTNIIQSLTAAFHVI